MIKRESKGNVLIVATLGLLFLALLLLQFQKVLVSKLIENEAKSYAEKAAYIKFFTSSNIASQKLLKQIYGEYASKRIQHQLKDNFWGVESKVKVKIPYRNVNVIETFKITAPGRIIK